MPPSSALMKLVKIELEQSQRHLGSCSNQHARDTIRTTMKEQHNSIETSCEDGPAMMELHWLPGVERRGLGVLIQMVNHIALIVSDVGRSASFYTDVLGCQQINRPNFDRHGAWFTLGNVELQLIKVEPLVHTGSNLIVSHIAIDVSETKKAFQRLKDMEVPLEINVSVPKVMYRCCEHVVHHSTPTADSLLTHTPWS
jgi:Glyoxalase/Bleomycin resistance protein/Dioxygenase superfamily